MFSRLIGTIFFVAVTCTGNAQTRDNSAQVEVFIKTWGFIKYHHPSVANGSVDWDSVFISNISNVMADKTLSGLNKSIQGLMDAAGTYPLIQPVIRSNDLFLLNRTDLGWAKKSVLLSNEVKSRLQFIYDNKNQDSNRYVKILYQTADFRGEKKYGSIDFPDQPHRLLLLARFWNVINYFAPYKYLASDWNLVLKQFIPQVRGTKNKIEYYRVLQALCTTLRDGHSGLVVNGQLPLDILYGKYAAPFYCTIIDNKVLIRHTGTDSLAKAINIQKGDYVLSVDGRDVNAIIEQRKKYLSTSNQNDGALQLSRFLLDGDIETSSLKIKRGNKIISTSFKRISPEKRDWKNLINYEANDSGYKKIGDSILLIYAAQIWDGNIERMKQLVKNTKAVIFDVRNYPGNDAFFYFVDAFLAEPATIEYSTIAMPGDPGFFTWRENPNKIGHKNDSAYKGKVVILCDERTQSQGEYSCMVLQTIPQAVTIGSRTAGCDGVVTYIPMGGGVTLSYSGYGVYYPDKTQTQRVGVKIDIPVKKTAEAIGAGKDEILERALLYIHTQR